LDIAVNSEKTGNTAIFAAVNGQLAGVIREEAFLALENIRENGIRNIIMLTGDNEGTAQLVAKQLRIDEYHAEIFTTK